MLKVLINNCPPEQISKNFKGFKVISDIQIFKILNEEEAFNSGSFCFNDMEKFADAIVQASDQEDILIHSFNIQLLNWFSDEIAKQSFIAFLNEKFINFFEIKKNLEKIGFLGPGEVISRFDFKDY